MPTHDYSDSEQKLIAYFGFTNLMENLLAPPMYRLLVESAFMRNDNTEFADALRAANHAFIHRTCHRGTDEFDAIIEDILYTEEMRINDRHAKLIDFWNDNLEFIGEQIKEELKNDSNNNSGFKWGQLVQQEIFMYNRLNKQLEYKEFNELCIRRGFNAVQREFIVDALRSVGLTETLDSMALVKDTSEDASGELINVENCDEE